MWEYYKCIFVFKIVAFECTDNQIQKLLQNPPVEMEDRLKSVILEVNIYANISP